MTRFARRWLTCFVLSAVALAGCSERSRGGGKAGSSSARSASRGKSRGAADPGPVGLGSAAPREDPPLPEEAPKHEKSGTSGGSLHVHLEAEPPHLNPLQEAHEVVDRVVGGGLVYETLLECRRAGYRPALAERWETSPDGLRVTLHLRSGVRWHDDRPFGPMDVQATFEAVQRSTSRAPLLRTLLGEVLAVEIAPERQVRIRLSRPSGYVLRALCDLPILPEPALRGGAGPLATLGRVPVGTGPFRFAAWERGKRIKLQRNRAGWGEPPAIDELVFEIDGDGTRALTRTRRGEIDVLPRLLEIHYPEQVGPSALGDRLAFVRLSPARYSFIAMNHERPPLGDVRFRRALSLLWSREALADAHHGLAHPIAGPPFGATATPRFAPKEAARVLDEAGYRDTNGDGVRERDGRPIRLTVLQPAGSRAFAQAAKSFALELRKAGLLLDLATVDPATLAGRMERGEFDLAPARWEGAPDEDPRPLFAVGGEHNVSRYRSDRAHAILEALRTADGPAARAPLLGRLAAVLADELPVLFLYRHEQAVVFSRRVQGLAAPAGRLDLRRVWLAP